MSMGQVNWKITTPKATGAPLSCLIRRPTRKRSSGLSNTLPLSTRDLSILGGDTLAEAEVQRVIDFIEGFKEAYPEVYSELTLKTEKIFGTLDHLGLNRQQNSRGYHRRQVRCLECHPGQGQSSRLGLLSVSFSQLSSPQKDQSHFLCRQDKHDHPAHLLEISTPRVGKADLQNYRPGLPS